MRAGVCVGSENASIDLETGRWVLCVPVERLIARTSQQLQTFARWATATGHLPMVWDSTHRQTHVDRCTTPLTPAAAAFDVDTITLPVVPAVLSPDVIDTDPPVDVAAVADPAVTTT